LTPVINYFSHDTIRQSVGKGEKIMAFQKGHIPWMKGKHHTLEARIKMSKSRKGRIPWNKGKIGYFSEEARQNISKGRKGKVPWNKDKTGVYSKETKRKMRENHADFSLDKHPRWKGGASFEPYGIEFNGKLKQQIRDRDNHICQECGLPERLIGKKLDVHHIDFDKYNNDASNLISLCKSCHTECIEEVKK